MAPALRRCSLSFLLGEEVRVQAQGLTSGTSLSRGGERGKGAWSPEEAGPGRSARGVGGRVEPVDGGPLCPTERPALGKEVVSASA